MACLPLSVIDILRNSLVLHHVSPYLGVSSLLALAATSSAFRDLIYTTPSVFRHIDLSKVRTCLRYTPWNLKFELGVEPTDLLTTEDFLSQPIRKALYSLQWRDVLKDVRTLVLDGLPVPSPLVREILCEEAYNIRILSIRQVSELSDEKLMQILRYITRPTRPEDTPKLKGLYYFTPLTANADFTASDLRQSNSRTDVMNRVGAQLGGGSASIHRELVRSSRHQRDPWYSATGEVFWQQPHTSDAWASFIESCAGVIAFDVIPCCRHGTEWVKSYSERNTEVSTTDSIPKLATISVGGCNKCGSCPEGPMIPGQSPEYLLPLLAPAPLHFSSVKACRRLDTGGLPHPFLVARCKFCLKDRWCERCNAWWCESCYTVPKKRTAISPKEAKNHDESIKVHNNLCVSKCLMDELLNGVGEGGMWG